MSERPNDLLTDPCIGVIDGRGDRTFATLPAILAGLGAGESIEFTALQPHQTHAWYAFLVQVSALCLHAAGAGFHDLDADAWRRALITIAGGKPEAWMLAVPDLTAPAFFQPPVPEGTLGGWGGRTGYPDEIDVLVTSKNHDVKQRRIGMARAEHWLYALVTLQTTEGYSGKFNYGIARMNGGYGNRAAIGTASGAGFCDRLPRDVSLLVERRGEIAGRHGFRTEQGIALGWLPPWDGRASLRLEECDPFHVEICRRVRLVEAAGRIEARVTSTTSPRLAAEERKGDLGDPWIPIRVEDHAALTARNLSYQTIQAVLFSGDYVPSPASLPRAEDGAAPFVFAQALVRGQGMTEGYHERTIPLRPRGRKLLATTEGRERLGVLSQQRVDAVSRVRREVLRPALLTLVQGAPDRLDLRDDRVDSITATLDARVDRVFFDRLFDDVERGDEARVSFERFLVDEAREILDAATRRLPLPSARRYRAIALATRRFEGAARKLFPDVFRTEPEGAEP